MHGRAHDVTLLQIGLTFSAHNPLLIQPNKKETLGNGTNWINSWTTVRISRFLINANLISPRYAAFRKEEKPRAAILIIAACFALTASLLKVSFHALLLFAIPDFRLNRRRDLNRSAEFSANISVITFDCFYRKHFINDRWKWDIFLCALIFVISFLALRRSVINTRFY